MKWRLVLAVALVAAASAHAQTKKELAAKVVQLQQEGIQGVGRTIAGRSSQQMLQAAGQALPRVPADKREAVAREIQADVKKYFDEVEPLLKKRSSDLAPGIVGAAYEEKFTEDELKQIIAWIESPVSKKYAQFEVEQGNALAERVWADTRPTIEPKLKALEATIGRRLGLPPPPAASAPKK